MKVRTICIVLLSAMLMASCGKKTVFEQRQKFEDLKWNRFKELKFEFTIKDTTSLYDMTLLFRHHTVYPYGELFFTMALYTPSGERRISDFHVPVKNAYGKFLAQGNGDLWDMDYPLFKGMSFNEPGKYRVEMENRMDKFDTEGIMELGLKVNTASGDGK